MSARASRHGFARTAAACVAALVFWAGASPARGQDGGGGGVGGRGGIGPGRGGGGRGMPGPARDDGSDGAVGSGEISGVVVVLGSGSPVRRAQVTLSGQELRGNRTALTDDQGRFAFQVLPSGRFMLTASKPGHVNVSYGAKRPGRPGT